MTGNPQNQNPEAEQDAKYLLYQIRRLEKSVRRLENRSNTHERQKQSLHRTTVKQSKTIKELRDENRQLKLMIKEFQEKFYKKHKRKEPDEDEEQKPPKKRGAPKGHPGTTRKKPDHVDEHVDVYLKQCPGCGGKHLSSCQRSEDHYQEDIVIPQAKVTRFRHHFYWCSGCKKVVHGVGKGELPGSYIGPTAKSLAAFLHYKLRIPYRPIGRLFRDAFGLSFDASSVPGFDRQLRIRGAPLYEKIKKSLKNKPFNHVDETGWRKDGINHWLWCFAAPGAVIYLIDRSRGSKVVASVLGDKYDGVLISDFLAAYNKLKSRKQRCLVHLLRLIKKYEVYFDNDKKRHRYFRELKGLVKDVIALSKKMAGKRPKNFIDLKADLVARLRRKLKRELGHQKADKFTGRLSARFEELVTCLDFDEVCSHNNWAERLLRGNVIMRKVTFGNRSDRGVRNHQVITSLSETAALNDLDPLQFLRQIFIDPAAAAAAILPAATSGR